MGTLRAMTDHSGEVVNGITLGDSINPSGPCPFAWDDSRLPNGILHADGTITPDEDGI